MRRFFTSSHPLATTTRTLVVVGLLLLTGAITALNVLDAVDLDSAQNIASTQERVIVVIRGAAWASGSLAVLILLISIGLAMRARRSMRRIADGAAQLASGDLSHRIPPTNDSELDLVVDGLNTMARELERMLRATQMQRSEQGAILDAINAAMIAVDCDLGLLRSNRTAEKLYGLAAGDRNRPLEDVLKEEVVHELIRSVLANGRGFAAEFDSQVLDNQRLNAVAERMFDATGRILGVVVVIENVTELRQVEQVRVDFAANVSHELRTPITNIKGYAETLELGDEVDEQQTTHCLRVIRRNADRLNRIIDDLLTLARLDQVPYTEEGESITISARQVVTEAIDRVMVDAREQGVEFNVACEDDLRVHTRGNLLVQALTNLLVNAVRYGPRGQIISIRAKPEENAVVFEIEDQGPGIPKEHLPRLFERFYRVDKARSRAEGGTGLGLAIVKHIALVHGGAVSVESQLDRGSVFRIEIPGQGMTLAHEPTGARSP